MLNKIFIFLFLLFLFNCNQSRINNENLSINGQGYFEKPGLDVMVFSDYYPEGHQSGVTVIQHGVRVAANGDVRLEVSPGQWSPVPKTGPRTIDSMNNIITQKLWYPDTSRMSGFNAIDYPDLTFTYEVKVTPLEGSSFRVTVDLDQPLPAEWIGKVGFNLELFPGILFGKTYLMDDKSGIFPTQPVGPIIKHDKEYLAAPLAAGHDIVVAPEDKMQRMKIHSNGTSLELWDGRTNHNNGWYIVRSVIPPGKDKNAIEWIITPNVIPDWTYKPVIHVSQLGYETGQQKRILIEQDKRDKDASELTLYRLTENGKEKVLSGQPQYWGQFLRFNYLTFDLSDVREPGMYMITYRSSESNPFMISDEVYNRFVWQPTLDYFLPAQMCHMRVNEKYRVWHGACHLDDALMAPLNHSHFDGYHQGPSTLTKYRSLQHVPMLDAGGWHDAGDFDLRVESQIGTVYKLALMIEEFGLDYDATTIDQKAKVVEIHQPDGKSDALQQIEHGLLTVLGGYHALGRLYRGIICPTLRQYVLLGDPLNMTDNLDYNPNLGEDAVRNMQSGKPDDRYVFTEENPGRSMYVAAGLAAASRVLKESNPELSEDCLNTARQLWNDDNEGARAGQKIMAIAELILTTKDEELITELVGMKDEIVKNIGRSGWVLGRVMPLIRDENFKADIANAVSDYEKELQEQTRESPFGVPYRPNIWGAGWIIQNFGVSQYFFYKGWPESVSPDFFINSLNFILGVHPGENTSSFASGVGSESATVAYGYNRADWSYIPGGVVSGTALIRPDLPEMKIWPFFWQQTEYVLGGGATNFMFLAMAANDYYMNE